jgi:hypothetical protein
MHCRLNISRNALRIKKIHNTNNNLLEEVDDGDLYLSLEQEEVEEQPVVEQDLQEGNYIEPLMIFSKKFNLFKQKSNSQGLIELEH